MTINKVIDRSQNRGFALTLTLFQIVMLSSLVLSAFMISQMESKKGNFYSQFILDEISYRSTSEKMKGQIRESLIRQIRNDDAEAPKEPYPVYTPQTQKGLEWSFTSFEGMGDNLSVSDEESETSRGLRFAPEVLLLNQEWEQQNLTSKGKNLNTRVHVKIYNNGGLPDAGFSGKKRNLTDPTDPQTINFSKIEGGGDSFATSLQKWREDEVRENEDWIKLLDSNKQEQNLWSKSTGRDFLSRKDFLEYCKENGGTGVEKYLNHLLISPNQINSYPMINGTDLSAVSSQIDFQYKTNSQKEYDKQKRRPNLNLNTVSNPAKTEWKSFSRFPLNAIRYFDESEKYATEIKKYFGLQKESSSDSWLYIDAKKDSKGNTQIYQLNDPEFLALKRDPNFFELLQAGILSGSIGQNSQSNEESTLNRDTWFLTADFNSILNPYHVFQIGLNIVDQFDKDGYPTSIKILGKNYKSTISFSDTRNTFVQDARDVYITGQEASIPYLAKLHFTAIRPSSGTILPNAVVQPATLDFVSGWNEFEFWSPYLPASKSLNSNAPQLYRILPSGQSHIYASTKAKSPPFKTLTAADALIFRNPTTLLTAPRYLLQSTLLSTPIPTNTLFTENAYQFNVCGIYWATTTGTASQPTVVAGKVTASPNFNFSSDTNCVGYELQYQKNGQWFTYQSFKGFGNNAATVFSFFNGTQTNMLIGKENIKLGILEAFGTLNPSRGGFAPKNTSVAAGSSFDPRSDRLGFSEWTGSGTIGGNNWTDGARDLDFFGASRNKVNAPCFQFTHGTLNQTIQNNTGNTRYHDLYFNDSKRLDYTTFKTYYYDNDFIIRPADGSGIPVNTTLGAITNDVAEAPQHQIIDSPIRSVADLGLVYRGLPWKTLNFSDKTSGDGALLDIFSTTSGGAMTRGRLDLNSVPNADLLQSCMEEIPEDYKYKPSFKSSDQKTLAENLFKKRPFHHLSDVVSQMDDLMGGTTKVYYPDKIKREALLRGVPDRVETRYLHLAMDVSMKNQGATEGSFKVNEHRWLFLVFDRLTGKIVYQEEEPVI